MNKTPETIKVPIWWKTGGGGMINRSCLAPDHPESTYSYIKNVLHLRPENYGYYLNDVTRADTLQDLSKLELIDKVISLEKELELY
jgi:hypothetical protein